MINLFYEKLLPNISYFSDLRIMNILCANVGKGLNSIDTKRKVLHTLYNNAYENKDTHVLALQESGCNDFIPEPFFKQEINKNTDCFVGETDGENFRRGVTTYANPNDSENIELSEVLPKNFEILASSHTYVTKKGSNNSRRATRKLILLNCYRTIHKKFRIKIEEFVEKIEEIMKYCRQKFDIRSFVVAGDFNYSNFRVRGLKEVINAQLYHKNHENSAKTRIDKVFSNIPSCEISHVYDTCENKKGDSGHKAYNIKIGNPSCPPEYINIVKMSIVKLNSKNFDVRGCLDINASKEEIEKEAADITKYCQKILENSYIKTLRKKKSHSAKVLDAIEEEAEALECGKNKNPSKTLYRLVTNFKEGLYSSTDSESPPVQELAAKITDKLEALEPVNYPLMQSVVSRLAPEHKIDLIMPEPQVIVDCMLSVSNSAALDYHKLSLKYVKVIVSHSKVMRKRIIALFRCCLKRGLHPDVFSVDVIRFLYKRKGPRSKAENYRPITIAPSLGKMLEKVALFLLKQAPDKNHKNHAYIEKRSCLTAICSAMAKIEKIKNSDAGIDGNTKVVALSMDDASSAFECIPHRCPEMWCRANFTCRDIKIDEYVGSYLQRKSIALNELNIPAYEIKKRFKKRTSPQGSLLSPFFWRIFDMIFGEIFSSFLESAVEENKFLTSTDEENFTDDKYTALHMLFPKCMSTREIGVEINKIIKMVRELLIVATTSVGCKINPSKSESIVEKKFTEFVKNGKSEFVWLGYSLALNSRYELVFTEKKLHQSTETTRTLINKIFTYTECIAMRRRVFVIYVAPIIELYMPLAISANRFEKYLESFQHSMLGMVLCLDHRCSALKCREVLNISSVQEKAKKCADRLMNFDNIEWMETAALRATRFIERSNMSLRSNRRLTAKQIDRLDFVGRVVNLGKKDEPRKMKRNFNLKAAKDFSKKTKRLQAKFVKNKKKKSVSPKA